MLTNTELFTYEGSNIKTQFIALHMFENIESKNICKNAHLLTDSHISKTKRTTSVR